MVKRWCVFISLLIVLPSSFALPDMIRAFGGSAEDTPYAVVNTSDNGYVFAGQTKSFSAQNKDVWVVKVNSSGLVEWQVRIGGASDDGSLPASTGSNLNFAGITLEDGGTAVAVATGTNSTGAGDDDGLVVKLNSTTGVILWQRTFGNTTEEALTDIGPVAGGGFYVAGSMKVSSQFEGWVLKLDTNGTVVWQNRYGGTQDDYIFGLVATSDGGVATVGYSYSSPTQDAGDVWVQKLNSTGGVVWTKVYGFGAGSLETGTAIAEGTDGELGVVGGYSSDVWFLRLNKTNGNVLFENRYGGSGSDGVGDVLAGPNGGYIVAASTQSFGASSNNVWIFSINSTGSLLWERQILASGDDQGRGIKGVSDSGIGVIASTPSYGAGDVDAWLVKVNGSGQVLDCTLTNVTTATVTSTSATVSATGWSSASTSGGQTSSLSNATTTLSRANQCLSSTITDCATLSSEGTYRLNSTISAGAGECFTLTAAITLNCSSNSITVTGGNAIVIGENANNSQVHSCTITGAGKAILANRTNGLTITDTSFSGGTTALHVIDGLNVTVSTTNFPQSKLLIENSSLASILWTSQVNVTTSVTLRDVISFGSGFTRVNTTTAAGNKFNTTAQVTLRDVSFSNPRPTVDPELDGTYTFCSDCVEESYSGGIFVFNVTSFSGHSSEETPSTVPEFSDLTYLFVIVLIGSLLYVRKQVSHSP